MTGILNVSLQPEIVFVVRSLYERSTRLLNNTRQELKTKEKEAQSVIGQLQSTKAAFRQTEGVLREQAQKDKHACETLQAQVDEQKKSIKSLRQENLKLESSLKETKQSLQTRLDVCTRDKQSLMEQVAQLKTIKPSEPLDQQLNIKLTESNEEKQRL